MLVNLNKILPRARKQGYAVGAFNTSNLEITQAIINAAQALKSPVIIAVSEKAIRYAGIKTLSSIIITLAKSSSVPVALHLDHGQNFELCRQCIKNGFTSLMIDASHLPFKDNVRITRQVVRYAHKYNVTVEAEIGRLAGIEDNIKVRSNEALYTDPAEARKFVRATDCDALAIAIGTSHGAYKFKGKPRLRIDILKQIARFTKTPLVLHGASGIKSRWINLINRFGGALEQAKGVPDQLIIQAVQNGISKINTDTDLRIAFTAAIRAFMHKNPAAFDPRKFLGYGRDLIQQVVCERIKIFGSTGQA